MAQFDLPRYTAKDCRISTHKINISNAPSYLIINGYYPRYENSSLQYNAVWQNTCIGLYCAN